MKKHGSMLIFSQGEKLGDFSGGPVAKTPSSQCRGPGFNPWSETWISTPQLRIFMPQLKIPVPQLRSDPAK